MLYVRYFKFHLIESQTLLLFPLCNLFDTFRLQPRFTEDSLFLSIVLISPLQFSLTRLNPSLILSITIPHGFQRNSDLIIRGSLQARCKIEVGCRKRSQRVYCVCLNHHSTSFLCRSTVSLYSCISPSSIYGENFLISHSSALISAFKILNFIIPPPLLCKRACMYTWLPDVLSRNIRTIP